MSNDSSMLKGVTENVTDVPRDHRKPDGYALLLVLLCVFVGGTLVLLSILLVLCRRCCEGGRRFSRASDDPEKTNTTYVEESQPAQDIMIRVDEADLQPSTSEQDMETERFLSTASTGRRVSFNESALLNHGRKAQEKGRRYTLTEGDFHHLKNARLTHLHLPHPHMKILTIPESPEQMSSKGKLSIIQTPLRTLPQTALTRLGLSPCSGLPGDSLNSTVDASFDDDMQSTVHRAPRSNTIEATGGQAWTEQSQDALATEGMSMGRTVPDASAPSQGSVLQLLTRLRRHASLEGVGPYFRIKKWKFDSMQRASSLEMRGSPKRRQFQRQRAASESTNQDENDAQPFHFIQYITHSSPPPSLGSLDMDAGPDASSSRGTGVMSLPPDPPEEELGAGVGLGAGPAVCQQDSTEHQMLYRDIWMLRASLEQYASSDQSSNNDKESVRSDAGSVSSLGGAAGRAPLLSCSSQDIGDELEMDQVVLLGDKDQPYMAGGKQDSMDSERGSDGESGNRKLLQMDSGYASIEAPSRAPEDLRLFGSSGGPKGKTASEKRHFFTSLGRKGSVCESLFEEEVAARTAPQGTCSPYRTLRSSQEPPAPARFRRRDYSIDEKTEALFNEFLRHDPQFDQQELPARQKHRSRVHLRKQWQRTKQNSDPGSRVPPGSLERQRSSLRRGDSASYPLDTRYHSTLSRIVSAADEDSSEGTAETPGSEAQEKAKASPNGATDDSPTTDPAEQGNLGAGYGPQSVTAEVSDKLALGLHERLYTALRVTRGSAECVATTVLVSPDHSPV